MAGKFNKKIDGESAFNSSVSYLDRIHYWMQQAHIFSADDDDIMDCFMALEQLSIEVDGSLDPDDRTELEKVRIETKKNILDSIKEKKSLITLREKIRPYHLAISRAAHNKGIMLLRTKNSDVDSLF